MKNIHVLPTSQPSRLHFTEFEEELVFTPNFAKLDGVNIYITSDEEIKEGDWKYNEKLNCITQHLREGKGLSKGLKIAASWCKKIILTTDQDLIKDGVQAIDDEFLEWFVKNPSCEFVKIYWNPLNSEYDFMIPQEEPKQRLEKYSERFDNKDNELADGIFNPDTWGKRIVEEPKQETLEEVFKRIFNIPEEKKGDVYFSRDIAHLRKGFKLGAKWQQEQDKNKYSDEYCYNTIHNLMTDIKLNELVINDDIDLKKWFEQFKKK